MALTAYKIEDRDMMFASTVDFRLSLYFFDSGLYTCAAVARLTLALAKLSCYSIISNYDGSYAVLSVTTRRAFRPMVDILSM